MTPEEKPKGPQDEQRPDQAIKHLLPPRAQVEILEKIELIKGDKERKDGHIFFRKNPEEITQNSPAEITESGLSLGQSPLKIEHEGQEVKHSCHAGHSLNDVGYGLGLDGMGNEDETCEERYFIGDRPIFPLEGGKIEGDNQEPVYEDPRQNMDKKVYEVVAENIESSKIIVQGEGKIGKNANAFLIGTLDEPLYAIPCEDLNLDIRILGDVAPIIEMERNRKRIRIGKEGHSRNESDGDQMAKKRRPVSFLGSRRSNLPPSWR